MPSFPAIFPNRVAPVVRHTALMATVLLIAGVLWIAAFVIFELVYAPMLLKRRTDS